jgi:hypothetical protein
LDPEVPHTWPEVKAMTLDEVDLLNQLLDARDEARALAEKRRKDKERDRG